MRRDQPSYTIDTLRELRAEEGPARPLILLVGADAFAELASWRDWKGLFEFAHFAVLTRPGHGRLGVELAEEIAPRRVATPADLRSCAYGKVLELPVTRLEISASSVRALLAAGREPRWLVPDALLADHSLLAPYRPSSAPDRSRR